MSRWRVLLTAVLCVHGFIQPCGAEEVPCTVTQDRNWTTYSVLHAGFTSDPSSRDYSWRNGSNNVLANENKAIDPVTNHSINTLVSSRCIPTVYFTGTIYSEGKIKTEYTATCNTNCSVSAQPQVAGTDTKIALWVVIPVLILVLVVCFLCYIFKNRIRKMCGCSQCGFIYMGVNKDNAGSSAV